MEFYQNKLSNGMNIVAEVKQNSAASAMGFFVKAGARDETPEIAGVSHFLEHMMFKGTEKRTALDISYELGNIGAQANAWTSEENTVYYMGILPEYFDKGLEVLSDMLSPALDIKEFDCEKKVILEEIALYKDRPTHVLFEAALKEFFTGHTAGNSVLGSTESVSGISRKQMKEYFDQRYLASNMTFVCSGNVDIKKTEDFLNSKFASWPQTPVTRLYPHFEPEVREKTIEKKDLKAAHACLVAPGPYSSSDLDRYAALVLCSMLGDSSGSVAYWELVDKGIAESAVIDSDQMDEAGLFYSYASCRPDNLDQVVETLENILRNAKSHLNEKEFERAKTKIASKLVLQGEASIRRLMTIGIEWVYRGRYVDLDSEVSKVLSLRLSDLEDLLNKYNFEKLTKVRLIPA